MYIHIPHIIIYICIDYIGPYKAQYLHTHARAHTLTHTHTLDMNNSICILTHKSIRYYIPYNP